MLISTAYEEYLIQVKVSASPNTITTYKHALRPFLEWCTANGVTTLEQLDKSALRRLAGDVIDKHGYTPAYQALIMTAVRRFLRWAMADNGLPDVSEYIPVPKLRPQMQRTLSRDEVRAMLDTCDDSPAGLRNAAIISLLVDTGIRASELVNLNRGDVSLDTQMARVRVKGGKEYNVKFGDTTRRRLSDYLHDAGLVDKPKSPLFVSFSRNSAGGRLNRSSLRVILHDIGRQARIEDVSPHAFRRTFATELLRSGVPTRIVQIMGRWGTSEMVSLYSRQLEQETISISLADILDENDDSDA